MSLLRKRSPVDEPVEDEPSGPTYVHGPAPSFRVYEPKPAPLMPIYAHRKIEQADYRADVGMRAKDATLDPSSIMRPGLYTLGSANGVFKVGEPEPQGAVPDVLAGLKGSPMAEDPRAELHRRVRARRPKKATAA